MLLLLPLMAMASEVDTAYVINKWMYEAQVHEDNTWTVTETMTVTFSEERHGIYRYIPRKFVRNRADGDYSYATEVLDVDVVGETHEEEGADDEQDNYVIRIGDADNVVSGQHQYIIKYTLQYPDDRVTTHDELIHTLLGADCNTTIGRFEYVIRFDKALPKGFGKQLKTYSGEWGQDGNVLNVAPAVAEKTISGVVDSIAPFNAITIAANLPEGYWQGEYSVSDSATKVWYILFATAFGIMLVLLLMHPRRRPTVVYEYNAPEGISSAEVGVIIDDQTDFSDMTSLVVWFASKGYLKITETEIEGKKKDTEITLTKRKELEADAPKYQRAFWEVLFGEGKNAKDSVVLSKLGDRHEQITQAMLALSAHFKGERKLTSVNLKMLGMWLLCIIAGVGALMTSSSVARVGESQTLYGLVLWAFPILFATILRLVLSNYDMIKKRMWLYAQLVACVAAAAIDLMIMYAIFDNPNDLIVDRDMMGLVTICGWVIVALSGRMITDSRYRLEKMSLLLGFRDFIEKSELPMLKAQVDENPSYFFDVLPYAMVFGLTDKWLKQFKELDIQCPDWYESSVTTRQLNGYMLADHLIHSTSKSMMSTLQVSSHDPNAGKSSGGGGFSGGFSGGGGGGGGVRSW